MMRRRLSKSRGFTFVELLVAAVVLFIASIGVFQTLTAMSRHSSRVESVIQANRFLVESMDFLREVGYDSVIASGSSEVASALATQYAWQLNAIATGSSVAVSMADTIPGAMLDATVSLTFRAEGKMTTVRMASSIAKGGPL